MSEISNYEAQKKKLQGLCDEHNFTFRFFKDRYPITLVITPHQRRCHPDGYAGQCGRNRLLQSGFFYVLVL